MLDDATQLLDFYEKARCSYRLHRVIITDSRHSNMAAAKKDLRKKMRDILRTMPNESLAAQSTTACATLLALPEYRKASRIAVFLSMPSGELSTTNIVQDALKTGKEVFIPYIHLVETPASSPKKTSIMDMLSLASREEFEQLVPDTWGIPSLQTSQIPGRRNCFGGLGVSMQSATVATNRAGLDLIVMPGMAFDYKFRRLGHGRGYYDHFLTRYSKYATEGRTETSKMPFLGEKPFLGAVNDKRKTST